MKKYAAFFDIDNTILDAVSGKAMAVHGYKNGLIRNRNIMEGLAYSILYRLRLMKSENVIKKMSGWMAGISEKEIIDFTARLFNGYLKDKIREKARHEIDIHRVNGGQTVILSATTRYLCELIKAHLSMDDIICSKMEVINGRYSGFPLTNYCYGKEKLVRVEKYCEEHSFDLKEAYYYGDSAADIPVLEVVGHPRCVTPEKKLERVAKERGWKIIRW